jgi:hypothetical protein
MLKITMSHKLKLFGHNSSIAEISIEFITETGLIMSLEDG